MAAYGFSAHAPVPVPTDWCIKDDQFPEYLNEINRLKEAYKHKIQVYLGLEIDFIPGIAGRKKHLNQHANLDYYIGSVHFVERLNNGEGWNIDISAEIFQQGLEEIFNNDIRKAATRFWELTEHMIQEEKPDIIGHLDKIKMFNIADKYFHEHEKWYSDQVRFLIPCIKKSGSIVEINTRGYYRYGRPDLYPSEWIIRLLNEHDIPLIISSDAHKPEEITKGMAYAANRLKEIGVRKLSALCNNEWKQYPFDENGLIINNN